MALDSESRKQNEAMKIGAASVRNPQTFSASSPHLLSAWEERHAPFRLKEAQGHVGGGQTTGDLGQAQWVGLMKPLNRASRSGGASGLARGPGKGAWIRIRIRLCKKVVHCAGRAAEHAEHAAWQHRFLPAVSRPTRE